MTYALAHRGRVLDTTFDPLTEVPCLRGLWAMDHPGRWTRPADAAAVASWPDIGGSLPAHGTPTQRPTMRYATVAVGNRSTVQFDGGDILDVDITDIAQPVKLLLVASFTATGVQQIAIAFNNANRGPGKASTNVWALLFSA